MNELRKQLFTQKTRTIDNIPPTRDELLQHTKRTAYQGSVIWGNCLGANPSMPTPDLFGWQKLDGTWVPFLSVLADASMSCQDLIHCKK